jgi:hypothetical protein
VIQESCPALKRAYHVKPDYVRGYSLPGNAEATVQFVNERDPLHPAEFGKLQYLRWSLSNVQEMSLDVRQERQYELDEEEWLTEQRKEVREREARVRRE